MIRRAYYGRTTDDNVRTWPAKALKVQVLNIILGGVTFFKLAILCIHRWSDSSVMKFLEDYLPEFYAWLNLNITSVFAVGLVGSDFVYKRTGTVIFQCEQ